MTTTGKGGYKLYWQIWLILLILTMVMIFIDQPTASALQEGGGQDTVLIAILVAAMLLKAFLIASYFMHLRFERLFLGLSVVVGLVLNGFILFGLLVPDGLRIHEMLR